MTQQDVIQSAFTAINMKASPVKPPNSRDLWRLTYIATKTGDENVPVFSFQITHLMHMNMWLRYESRMYKDIHCV